ncbi:MAG TPA: hypothetical protein VF493_18450 [Terriglobales bacterium]
MPGWVAPGRPICIVEFKTSEQVAIPREAFPFKQKGDLDFMLWHYWLWIDSARVGVWIIRRNNALDSMVRSIRVSLVRRSAEMEALRRILQAVAKGTLVVDPRSQESDALQRYFNDVNQRLRRIDKLRMQLPTIDLTSYPEFLGDQLRPGERDALLAQLENTLRKIDIRPNVLNNTLATAQTVILTQEVNMGNKIDARGAHGVIGIDVSIDKINNSFNQTTGNADQDLKDKLEALKSAVTELVSKAPEKADEVSRDFDTFARESTAAKPRKSILKAIGETLVEAASTVTTVAAAISTAVDAVIHAIK